MDGSGLEEGIGAAAVIYRKGSNIPLNHLKAYLGPSTKHNSYKGEAVGGLLVCWLIRNTIGTDFKMVSIYIDNQALIKIMVAPKVLSGQYLVQAFADMADNLTAKITVQWISSHSDVKGNEQADKLAKEAAKGKASRCMDLPPILHIKLPNSTSATKEHHLEQLKSRWKLTWLDSPR